jgi:DNA-binding MarR family transcriptional regulator
MTRDATPSQAEIEANSQLKKMNIDHDSMATLSNIFRVATKFRSLVEREVLTQCNLSFSTFTILWITWLRGPQEFKELAIDCGVSKGTMTGLIKSLTKFELVSRVQHETDARRLMIKITPTGRSLIKRIFPKVNRLETSLTQELKVKEKQEVAKLLRIILNTNPS